MADQGNNAEVQAAMKRYRQALRKARSLDGNLVPLIDFKEETHTLPSFIDIANHTFILVYIAQLLQSFRKLFMEVHEGLQLGRDMVEFFKADDLMQEYLPGKLETIERLLIEEILKMDFQYRKNDP